MIKKILILLLLTFPLIADDSPISYPSAERWQKITLKRYKYKSLTLSVSKISNEKEVIKIYPVGDLLQFKRKGLK